MCWRSAPTRWCGLWSRKGSSKQTRGRLLTNGRPRNGHAGRRRRFEGLRLYEWARLALPRESDKDHERWLLIRRNRKEPNTRAYYLVFAPKGATLAELAGAAGLRWTIEECFERAKSDLGLDHCEARSWHGWHRHMTLVMAAAAFLQNCTRRCAARLEAKRTKRIQGESFA